MIQAGTYRARAVSGKFGKSANKGTIQVEVDFQIIGGQFDGQRIVWTGYFPTSNPKVSERANESLVYCGWDGVDYDGLTGLTSNDVELVCENEPYTTESGEEKTRVRVQWVNEIRKSNAKPLIGTDLEAFKQRNRANVAAVKSRRSNGASSNESTSNNESDDAIPF